MLIQHKYMSRNLNIVCTSIYCDGRNLCNNLKVVTKRSQIKTATHLHKTALTSQSRSQIKKGHYQIVMNLGFDFWKRRRMSNKFIRYWIITKLCSIRMGGHWSRVGC